MSGPITFIPMTHDTLPDPCDGPTSFKEIADGAASNYSQFNAWAKSSSTRISVLSGRQSAITNLGGSTGGDGRWTNVPEFPFSTVTLPAKLDFGLLIIYAQCAAGEGSVPNPVVAYKVDATGPGLGAAWPAEDRYFTVVARGYRNLHEGSRWWAFPPGQLVPGASLTLRPWVACINAVNAYLVNANWDLLTWSGEAP